jgi:hypothetical protein
MTNDPVICPIFRLYIEDMERVMNPEKVQVSERLKSRPTLLGLRRWVDTLQWLAPALMVLIVVAYELGPARWLHQHLGGEPHILAEILFFGTLGPAVVYILFHFLRRWLEERETSDLQALILEQAHARARETYAATDEAIQALFAASVLLASLESKNKDFTPEEVATLHSTRQALDQHIEHLRGQLPQ